MFHSTGERSVLEMLSEDNRLGRVRAGQMVRMLNLKTGGQIVMADSDEEAKEVVHVLRHNAALYHGSAGPEFLRRLIGAINDGDFSFDDLRDAWDDNTRELMIDGLEVHQQRAIRHLALLAVGGCLACELDILPCDQECILSAVRVARGMYLASDIAGDGAAAARRLRDYIADNLDRFAPIVADEPRGRGDVGYKWFHNYETYYLFTRKSLCQAAGVLDPNELLRFLRQYQSLHMNNGSKLQSKVPFHKCMTNIKLPGLNYNRQLNMYCVSERLLEWQDDEPHPRLLPVLQRKNIA